MNITYMPCQQSCMACLQLRTCLFGGLSGLKCTHITTSIPAAAAAAAAAAQLLIKSSPAAAYRWA
jgi:hypothetical protein